MTSEKKKSGCLLLKLPAELIHHVLTFLDPQNWASLSRTCRLMNEHTLDDRLWQGHLTNYVPGSKFTDPSPSSSFKDLFMLHHPYWFIPKFRIWYADDVHHGKLIIARYSRRRQCIEAYALAAERGVSKFEFWDWNREVIIHSFEPKVQLDLNHPVLKLDAEQTSSLSLRQRCSQEIVMDTHSSATMTGFNSRLMLSRALREEAIGPGTQVWPPQKLPAMSRTRNASEDAFRSAGHRPTEISQVSEHTFRLRRWMDFASRMAGLVARVGEDVSTFATLPPEAYTPTKSKPWRGIWCGDYSGHGCEFLVVLQPDEPVELPEDIYTALQRRRSSSVESESSWQTALSTQQQQDPATTNMIAALDMAHNEAFDYEHLFEGNTDLNLMDEMPISFDAEYAPSSSRIVPEDDTQALEQEPDHKGQLMAVKLTGDPNIPRGEYTFLAPDISDAGLLRVADEEIFKGARIIRSVGHIAARGFRDDVYIPSQLILLSHDTLAQYWEAFGHISFYKRVDIDQFTNADD